MKIDVKIVAITALCILECVAMFTGTNGVYLLPVVALISGLAGFVLAPSAVQILETRTKKNGK